MELPANAASLESFPPNQRQGGGHTTSFFVREWWETTIVVFLVMTGIGMILWAVAAVMLLLITQSISITDIFLLTTAISGAIVIGSSIMISGAIWWRHTRKEIRQTRQMQRMYDTASNQYPEMDILIVAQRKLGGTPHVCLLRCEPLPDTLSYASPFLFLWQIQYAWPLQDSTPKALTTHVQQYIDAQRHDTLRQQQGKASLRSRQEVKGQTASLDDVLRQRRWQ